MKKLFVFCTLLMCSSLIAQKTVPKLIETGIEFHQAGKFEEAIETYKKALKIDKKSPEANCEIGITYISLKEYEKAIRHLNIALKKKSEVKLEAYIAKGTVQDLLGRSNESIKTYEQGIKEFPDHYLLRYNLGITNYLKSNLLEGEAAALKAVELNTFHASSHFLLGACQADQRKNVQSLLAMYFFLFLEPDTKRSIGALEISGAMERQGVERTSEKEINISLNLSEPNDPFGATSLILSLLNTGIESVNGDVKSAEQQFYDKTNSMFSTLKESREGNDGIWWDLYVDFYSQLQEHGHLEAFCYYIKQSNGGATVDWLNENEEKVNQMFTWTNEVYFKK